MVFMEIPEWTWYYDPILDLLILATRSSFRLYIFFRRLFSIQMVSWHFDPCNMYVDFPLHLAHLPYFLELAPSVSSIETKPSKESLPTTVLHVAESGSSFAGIEVPPKMQMEEDPEEPVLENGFILCRPGLRVLLDFLLCRYLCLELVSACLYWNA